MLYEEFTEGSLVYHYGKSYKIISNLGSTSNKIYTILSGTAI